MKFNQIICFSFVIIFATKTFASVSIQEKVLIDSPILKLGNIFNGLPENIANKKIGNSPEPGQKKIIRLQLIKRLVKNFEIDWNPNPIIDSIVVSRASREVTANELKDEIIYALNKNGIHQDYEIQIRSKDFISYVPIKSEYEVEIINLNYNEKTERFFANIKIKGKDFSPVITNLKGFARSVIYIPVLKNRVIKGQTLNKIDFEFIKVAKNRINENFLINIDEMIGMEASRNLRKGSPLKKSLKNMN